MSQRPKKKPPEKTSNTVCFACGVNYLTGEQKRHGSSAISFNRGFCTVCKQVKSVTHIKYYNYLMKP